VPCGLCFVSPSFEFINNDLRIQSVEYDVMVRCHFQGICAVESQFCPE